MNLDGGRQDPSMGSVLIEPKDNNFCVQRPSSLGGADGDGIYVSTEDCLYLDIVAPSNKKSELMPVMFWIHGGGNTSGLKDLYDFSKMAKKHDVLIVRINYRLDLLDGLRIHQFKNFKLV